MKTPTFLFVLFFALNASASDFTQAKFSSGTVGAAESSTREGPSTNIASGDLSGVTIQSTSDGISVNAAIQNLQVSAPADIGFNQLTAVTLSIKTKELHQWPADWEVADQSLHTEGTAVMTIGASTVSADLNCDLLDASADHT
jgi:hypothetical protein